MRLAAGRRWDWGGEALGKEAGERPTEPPGNPDLPGILALCRLVKTVAPHTRGNWERWVPDAQCGGDCVASGVGCLLRPLIGAAAFSSLRITFNTGSSLG